MSRKPRTDARLAVAYLRVSTDRQDLGPEAQRDSIERWAAAEGVEVVAWHEDHAVSGGADLDKRPALMAALDALADHKAGVLVVSKRDRLARDVVLGAMVERMAERVGARVVAADGAGNGDGPEALLMRRMVDAFAEYERAIIRARTRAALAAKRKRGERVGSVPYGYQLAEDGVHLDAVPAEQVVIARVRDLRAEGLTLRAIAAKLTDAGVAPRSGKCWHPQQVARMVAA